MAFDPSLLSRQDIIDAIRRIDADQQQLHPSTVYDVKFEEIHYPPKELLRIAYRSATGEDIGEFHVDSIAMPQVFDDMVDPDLFFGKIRIDRHQLVPEVHIDTVYDLPMFFG